MPPAPAKPLSDIRESPVYLRYYVITLLRFLYLGNLKEVRGKLNDDTLSSRKLVRGIPSGRTIVL